MELFYNYCFHQEGEVDFATNRITIFTERKKQPQLLCLIM